MRVLEARGLVSIRRRSGTRVCESTVDAYAAAAAMLLIRSDLTLGDILDARCTLESQLAFVAAERHEGEDTERARRALDNFAAAATARNASAAARFHVAFHTELLRATRLPAISILLQPIAQMMAATSVTPRGVERSDPEGWRISAHRALLEAVESRDRDAVAAANETHWGYTRGSQFAEIRQTRVAALYPSPRELLQDSHLGADEPDTRAPPAPRAG